MKHPHRFYHPGPLDTDGVTLSDAEARHACAARRLRPGAEVEIFDGAGASRRGVIAAAARAPVEVRFVAATTWDPPSSRSLTIALSPPKADRMAFAVEKLSELGCTELVPLIFRRSLDAGVNAAAGRTEKWRRKAIEAAKQCGRNTILRVAPAAPLQLFLGARDGAAAFFLDPDAEVSLSRHLETARGAARAVIVVGPEGGITAEERAALQAAGFAPARLWSLILRIETAAVAAAALFNDAGPHSEISTRRL